MHIFVRNGSIVRSSRVYTSSTHCKEGHELSGKNLLLNKKGQRAGCRLCKNLHAAASCRQFRQDFPNLAKAKDKISHAKYVNQAKLSMKIWRKKNLAHRRQYDNAYKKRLYSTPCGAVKSHLRTRLNSLIRAGRMNKSWKSSADLVGCSTQELMRHIERQFLKGMTWNNRSLWHIDHIRPCKAFDLTDPAQQRVCFHFTNLRPLWKKENLLKGSAQTFLL